jgi:uncharacterized protein YbcI
MADTQSADDAKRSHQSPSAQISAGLVQLTRDYTGRGPTRARTYISDGVVVCVLEDTLTKGERSLADRGEEEQVLTIRRIHQRLMGEEATTLVEEATGRRVVSFLSDNATDPDVAVEIFVLEG